MSDRNPDEMMSTADRTVTSTGAGLEPVCDPVPVPTFVLAWTPECAGDRSRIGERLLLRGRRVEVNRLVEVFPGGRIDDREMSRVHAELVRAADGSWSVRDQGSKNGTFVNGLAVAGTSGRVLDCGDIVRMGDSLFVFTETLFPQVTDAAVPAYIGTSDSAREVRTAISRYACSSLPVLVTGDSGVGKEVVSRALAAMGRPGRPIVEFNAANVSAALAGTTLFGNVKGAYTDARESRPGLFRAADGGTLFIDEVGELPKEVQAQLLRVIEDGMVLPVGAAHPVRVDVRIVAATNRNLRDDSVFRPDLFMRLAQLTIHVPPVRRRPEDIILFALEFSGGRPFTVRSMERMLMHPWPLNVREIRGIVAQTAAESSSGDAALDLPKVAIERMTDMAAGVDRDTQEDGPVPIDAAHVENALRSARGNMSQAARMVGRDRGQFYRIVRKFGFNPEDFR